MQESEQISLVSVEPNIWYSGWANIEDAKGCIVPMEVYIIYRREGQCDRVLIELLESCDGTAYIVDTVWRINDVYNAVPLSQEIAEICENHRVLANERRIKAGIALARFK